jgi:hypothetical protein
LRNKKKSDGAKSGEYGGWGTMVFWCFAILTVDGEWHMSMNFALTRHSLSFSIKTWWQDPMLMPTLQLLRQWFPRITAQSLLTWLSFVNLEGCPGLGSSPTDILPSLRC